MLYVTTRNDRDAYRVKRALTEDRGPDGGLFVPYHGPSFSEAEISALLEEPFEQCVAHMLNMLLDTELTGWDVSFYIGRYPVRLKPLGQRVIAAEAWHNPGWRFDSLVQSLLPLFSAAEKPTDWAEIAVRIAVLAGILCEMRKAGYREAVDVAVVCGEFAGPISAWYLRSWGFPIGNIICCCNENGDLWNLFANGQFRTDEVSVPTVTPDADVTLPAGLERLICACGEGLELTNYLTSCREGKTYFPSDAAYEKLRRGIHVSVVSTQRMLESIPRVFASRQYLLSPYDSLCYCGISDYRARFGETGAAVLLCENHPLCYREILSGATGLSEEEVTRIF